MKKYRNFLTLLLVPFILGSCSISVDLYSLSNEPGQKEDSGDEGEGGEDTPSGDLNEYKVSQSEWDKFFSNIVNTINTSNFTIETYSNSIDVSNKMSTLSINNGSALVNMHNDGSAGYLQKNNDSSYDMYSKEAGGKWEYQMSQTSFDYYNFLGVFSVYVPINFGVVTFVDSSKSYEADRVTIINVDESSTELHNVKASFVNKKLQSFTFEYPSSTGYKKQINVFKDYDSTVIDFDYDPGDEFIEQIILDENMASDEVGNYDDQFGKYFFHFENFEGGYGQSRFGRIRASGYIKNISPLKNLKSITVECDHETGISPIIFQECATVIDTPHQGTYYLYSTEEHNIEIHEDYFSLYVPNGEANIYSITLNFEKNYEHNDPSLYDEDWIQILYFNDLHGHVSRDPTSSSERDLISLTALLGSYYQTGPNQTITLSGGDQYQGSAYSNMSGGDCVSYMFNGAGVDAQLMGNHEFDWGIETIESTIRKCNFPTLGMNVFDSNTNQRLDFLEATTMIERGGHKIGIIGTAGNTYSSIAEYVRGGYYFKYGDEHTQMIKAYSSALRDEGAEFIILMTHDETYDDSVSPHKYPYDESLSSDGYVDLYLDAHTHQTYDREDDYGIRHMQAGANANNFAKITIEYSEGEWKVNSHSIQSNNVYDCYGASQIFQAFSQPGVGPNEVLEDNASYLSKQYISEELSNIYYEYLSDAGRDILLDNGIDDSIYLAMNYPLPRAYIHSGQVTFNDVYTALPFDNPLGVASIKGSDLSFVAITKENTTHYPSEITTGDIDPSKTYYVICDSFSFGYSSYHMTLIDTFNTNYLKENYPSKFENLVSFDSTGLLYARDMMRLSLLTGKYAS